MSSELDLSSCDNEPIHLIGAVQPHGVLLSADKSGLIVRVSDGVSRHLGLESKWLLGSKLTELGVHAEQLLALREEERTAEINGAFWDVRVFESGSETVFELEPSSPLSHASFLALRRDLAELASAENIEQLWATAAAGVRRLTGFDRVMVYRFDENWNGTVVAENKVEGLHSYLGLHFPASDIPQNARDLYAKNWLRLIVDATASSDTLISTTADALDLSMSSLRSVSPAHLEYLANMGVRASMSISIIENGVLWGLVSCHHHEPLPLSRDIRDSAELIGRNLSALLPAVSNREETRQALGVRATESLLSSAISVDRDVVEVLHDKRGDLLTMMSASGFVASLGSRYFEAGAVPPKSIVRAAVDALTKEGARTGVTDNLTELVEGAEVYKDVASGAAVTVVAGRSSHFLAWFRPELLQTIEWGGDPNEKYVHVDELGQKRISPRKSFESWRQQVNLHSARWRQAEIDAADGFAQHVTNVLFRREQQIQEVTAVLQRSLILTELPKLDGVELAARYLQNEAATVGGDWFDVVPLGKQRVAFIIGDVAGHGLSAAGSMTQLRNAARAYLMQYTKPSEVLEALNGLVLKLMPTEMATVLVATFDAESDGVLISSAGHPAPLFADTKHAGPLSVSIQPALGISPAATYIDTPCQLAVSDAVVFYSDGLVERRAEIIDDGIARAAAVLDVTKSPDELCDALLDASSLTEDHDDVALLVLKRTD